MRRRSRASTSSRRSGNSSSAPAWSSPCSPSGRSNVHRRQVANAADKQVAQVEDLFGAVPNRISTDERTSPPPAVSPVSYGQLMGALHVPRWNQMVIPVREGTGHDVLDTGAAGHYPTTALPGEIGNFSVAAHRRSYGSNFRRIDVLREGDPVVMETKDAWLVYHVTRYRIVAPTDGQVVLPVPDQPGVAPTQRLMTMTTCHPEYGNWQRYIVHLELHHWVPRNTGIPKELAEG
ncbi:class E sortase [Nanchangia anserum]|uniref:class E sortase n=1 Tax=Nanchangia anserum TaxID=2692125 RepID=UPI0018838CD7|nr:class E sortase [Nanchangia anserum]